MPSRIFIDGHAGTTGLRIRELLAGRDDLERIELPESQRKDPEAREQAARDADLVVLCLPDSAAREAVGWLPAEVRLIDASSAHRVDPGFVYGMPELDPGQREAIAGAGRVTSPGCYPSGVILALRPLREAGLLGEGAPNSASCVAP